MILEIVSVSERKPSSFGVVMSNFSERLPNVTRRKNGESADGEAR